MSSLAGLTRAGGRDMESVGQEVEHAPLAGGKGGKHKHKIV